MSSSGYNYPMDTDVYYHKLVTYRALKHELKFKTSQELFSAYDIDAGTKFLLRTIVEAGYPSPKHILDLGCGYGPLGLTLKSLYPESPVHLTDRDALAVDYARQNASLNNLEAEIYGSLGYDEIKHHDFDLIVSNIPGKAGEQVIAYLLQEARFYLKPGGITAIVVVSPLENPVTKILVDIPDAEIVLKSERTGHTVFHYRFSKSLPRPENPGWEREVYRRKDITIKFDSLEYDMQTAYGLPEFDSLSYETQLLFKTIKGYKNKEINHALVLNPGQGHVPVAVWQYLNPETISLVDRDLLALRYSNLNLVENGCPSESLKLYHSARLEINEKKFDLITGVLRDEGNGAAQSFIDRAAELMSNKGMMIISSGSTAITRIISYMEAKKSFNLKMRERWRGYSSLALEKT